MRATMRVSRSIIGRSTLIRRCLSAAPEIEEEVFLPYVRNTAGTFNKLGHLFEDGSSEGVSDDKEERLPNKGLTGVQPGIATGPTVSSLKNVKRFYDDVTVERIETENTYVVCLDGKRAKTPAKKNIAVASQTLAHGLALEWAMQLPDFPLDPTNMPLTILVSTVLDTPFVPAAKKVLIEEMLRYLETDTVRVWEDSKVAPDLSQVHEENWAPHLEWIAMEFKSAPLLPVKGLCEYHDPPAELVESITRYLLTLNAWELYSLTSVTRGAKSIILALQLQKRLLTVDEVFKLSRLDEEMQCKDWGVVEGGHDLDRAHLKVQLSAASTVMWTMGSTRGSLPAKEAL